MYKYDIEVYRTEDLPSENNFWRLLREYSGAGFATSGDSSGGKETTIVSIIQALLIYGMIIAGDPLDATGHYGVSCTGAPDRQVCQNAAKLGKRVAQLAMKIRG